jgi:hypothetical protein
MNPRSIRLHVEELVLEGFRPEDRGRIAMAMERELRRLLADHGVPPAILRFKGESVGWLDGGSFEIAEGSRPEALGHQVAHAVYRGMGR